MANVPKHIGIIMDGNRRFAKRLMLKPWKGHEWGKEKVLKLLEWCHELKIPEVTLYAFSIENFNRPKEEFDYLMELFAKTYNEMATTENLAKLAEKGVRITFIGRLWMFPENVQKAAYHLMEATKNNKTWRLNIAMAYGGRAEIIDATKRIAEAVKTGELDVNEINENVFQQHLYLESEPDLIIRTSGEKRISGFLLWQGSYAELAFCDKPWPEFEKEDLIAIIKDYGDRERRYGK